VDLWFYHSFRWRALVLTFALALGAAFALGDDMSGNPPLADPIGRCTAVMD